MVRSCNLKIRIISTAREHIGLGVGGDGRLHVTVRFYMYRIDGVEFEGQVRTQSSSFLYPRVVSC